MDPIGFISKEKPVYLYKIVRSNSTNASSISFKEFTLVKAWSSEDDNVMATGHRYFDYYYNGRLYKKQEVGLNEFLPFSDSRSFNVWSYCRDDDYAIKECKKWITKITSRVKNDIKARALKLMADIDFGNRLTITEN